MKKMTVAALAGLTLVLTSACGGDSRPSVDEISTALQSDDSAIGSAGIDEATADCFAEVFHDSDLSNEALTALVDGDEDFEGSDEDEAALEGLSSTIISECADVAGIPEEGDVPETEEG